MRRRSVWEGGKGQDYVIGFMFASALIRFVPRGELQNDSNG